MPDQTLLNRDLLVRHFGDLWPVHNRGFTELLIECRKHVGDMDQVLILSVIGDRTMTADRIKGLNYADFVEGERTVATARRINTQSVADSTGIPRETVRRKVSQLIERGWIRKNADCTLEVTEAAARDLAPATEATFDYFIALGNVLLKKATEVQASPDESRRAGQG